MWKSETEICALVDSYSLTNIYHTNEILGFVFINHELDSERGEGILVLYDTNQKILYDTV